ncbi:T9SS type A sorting domain-containing protein [Aureivirga sp. CE67]|uniref:T9SS type A sorting domain-containing protein n=1 Tax=Aureivirga sp. CE67 TaxID=1788983 RepID=UPI0018CA83F1|nr:T9SS type A sorting domain-containing protein [Aureivirga sp. CE67]
MRKILLFLVLLIPTFLFSQDCPDEILTFSTQAELDAFKTTYPDCTDFPKSIYVGNIDNDGSTIQNLDGLSNLTNIQGSLWIINNPQLQTLGPNGGDLGITALTNVDGDFVIQNNDMLPDLAGLQGLEGVGQGFFIRQNGILANLGGLDLLEGVVGEFEISENPQLLTLEGILKSITVTDLSINSNILLANFSGLVNEVEVEGELTIQSNAMLSSLTGDGDTAKINFTGTDLNIVSNNSLLNFEGMENVTTVGGDLYLQGNMGVTSFTGFENLETVSGSVIIAFNTEITNLVGFNSLTTITGDLLIALNEKMINMQGIQSLDNINGAFSISFNQTLSSLAGLEDLQNINGGLTISDNNILDNCTGICNILLAGNIQGGIFLSGNLANCNSESDLQTQCNDLDIEEIEEIHLDKIYPNPAQNKITFLVKNLQEVEIYNIQGRKVKTSKENLLDVSDLGSGMYMVKVISDKIFMEKLIIK